MVEVAMQYTTSYTESLLLRKQHSHRRRRYARKQALKSGLTRVIKDYAKRIIY